MQMSKVYRHTWLGYMAALSSWIQVTFGIAALLLYRILQDNSTFRVHVV